MNADMASWLNLAATAVGFGLTALRIGGVLSSVLHRLDTMEKQMAKVETTLNRDMERVERIVQRHGEEISSIKAMLGMMNASKHDGGSHVA